MADRIDARRRSENMSRIRSRDTLPERAVRKAVHGMGLRFRLHRKDLPGKPDLVLARWRLAVFVHGCFWHQHRNCADASKPKTRVEYWTQKFAANAARDRRAVRALRALGWRVLVIWECRSSDVSFIARTVQKALETQAVEPREDPALARRRRASGSPDTSQPLIPLLKRRPGG